MVRFLSAEWVELFDRIAASSLLLAGAAVEQDLVIEQVVEGAPHGDVAFHLRLSAAGARVVMGPCDDATVTFTQSYETAAAIASGSCSAQEAFMAGELRVGGRIDLLLAGSAALPAGEDLFDELRSLTRS